MCNASFNSIIDTKKPDMDKWFEENIEDIIKKLNDYGVDMKIRKSKRS